MRVVQSESSESDSGSGSGSDSEEKEQHVGLTKNEIAQLPQFKRMISDMKEGSAEDNQCMICMEIFDAPDSEYIKESE